MFELVTDVIERDKDGKLVKTGTKVFRQALNPLTNFVVRPKNTEPALPMVSWYPKLEGNVRLDKQALNSLGFLQYHSNDVCQSAQQVKLVSGVLSDGHGWSITPEIFHKSLICFGLRKLVKPNWLNNRDQFDIPPAHILQGTAWEDFSYDVVIYALFHNANYTSSLDPVVYKDNTFELRNNFFWMMPEEFRNIQGMPTKTVQDALRSSIPYTAQWLEDNKKKFSSDAFRVLCLAKWLVIHSASKRINANPKYQLHRWDAGRYQIFHGLFGKDVTFKPTEQMQETMKEFKELYIALGDRLRPKLYQFGILPEQMEL